MLESKYRDDGNGRYWDGTPAEQAVYDAWWNAKCLADNYQQLWADATAYTESYISGAAIGLLTIGVIQQKPISLSIMAWINNLWTNHYYPAKALINYDTPPYDFSVCGDMPYSIPELTQEVLQP